LDAQLIANDLSSLSLVSSVFDFLTFGLLYFFLKAGEAQFQTGWFVESLLTELFIVMVIRTHRPFWTSRPGRLLYLSTLIVAGLTLLLPYLPIGSAFGLVPLPPYFLAALVCLTVAYLMASEFAKRSLFHRFANPVSSRG